MISFRSYRLARILRDSYKNVKIGSKFNPPKFKECIDKLGKFLLIIQLLGRNICYVLKDD